MEGDGVDARRGVLALQRRGNAGLSALEEAAAAGGGGKGAPLPRQRSALAYRHLWSACKLQQGSGRPQRPLAAARQRGPCLRLPPRHSAAYLLLRQLAPRV